MRSRSLRRASEATGLMHGAGGRAGARCDRAALSADASGSNAPGLAAVATAPTGLAAVATAPTGLAAAATGRALITGQGFLQTTLALYQTGAVETVSAAGPLPGGLVFHTRSLINPDRTGPLGIRRTPPLGGEETGGRAGSEQTFSLGGFRSHTQTGTWPLFASPLLSRYRGVPRIRRNVFCDSQELSHRVSWFWDILETLAILRLH